MSHLQKAFIAKQKSKMHQAPQRMQRGLLVREAQKVDVVGLIGSKKNPKKRRTMCSFMPYWMNYDPAPSYLQFTLKK